VRDGAGDTERDVKSPGRAQASCRGMSGRDAASRAGHGRRSDGRDGVPPERRRSQGKSEGPQPVAGLFWLLFQLLEKVTRRKGGRHTSHLRHYWIYTRQSVTQQRGASRAPFPRRAWEPASWQAALLGTTPTTRTRATTCTTATTTHPVAITHPATLAGAAISAVIPAHALGPRRGSLR